MTAEELNMLDLESLCNYIENKGNPAEQQINPNNIKRKRKNS